MSRSGGSGTIHEDNATCLRGLVWMSPEVVSPDLIRAVGALTISCYRKIPGVGPRCVKVGNAAAHHFETILGLRQIHHIAGRKIVEHDNVGAAFE